MIQVGLRCVLRDEVLPKLGVVASLGWSMCAQCLSGKSEVRASICSGSSKESHAVIDYKTVANMTDACITIEVRS